MLKPALHPITYGLPLYRLAVMAILLALDILASNPKPAQADPILRLASLEWPPYNGYSLPGQGSNTRKLRNILQRHGIELEVSFYPWNRTMKVGKTYDDYAGYFPEYFGSFSDCQLSEAFDTAPLGIISIPTRPVHWQRLTDLRQIYLGIVDGYTNDGARLDNMINNGEIEVFRAENDWTLIRMLMANRLDAAVMDQNVMKFLTQQNGANHQFLFQLLTEQSLHVCAQNTSSGQAILRAIAAETTTN